MEVKTSHNLRWLPPEHWSTRHSSRIEDLHKPLHEEINPQAPQDGLSPPDTGPHAQEDFEEDGDGLADSMEIFTPRLIRKKLLRWPRNKYPKATCHDWLPSLVEVLVVASAKLTKCNINDGTQLR